MAKTKVNSVARIHCRVDAELKDKVESAARLSGLSLTSFTEMALAEKAQEVLDKERSIQLSQAAFQAFYEVHQAPPANPSKKLVDALKRYRRHKD